MVSVIIPCYNCSRTIDRAIKSVMSQNCQDIIEIILVNNNSTDNTLELLNSYKRQYPNFIFVYSELKKGAPAARNHGLKVSKGDWIQFLDADDELLPNKINRQLAIAIENSADIIAGGCLLKYQSAKKNYDIYRTVTSDVWQGLITSNLGITSSNFWRKSALSDVHGWDENLTSSQEYDLLLRMIKNSAKLCSDNEFNTVVYFSDNSVSKSSNKQRFKQIIENRINIRLRVKDELQFRSLLTPDLKTAIDTYIYTELINNSRQLGNYSTDLLHKYKPEVKLETVLKLKTKLFFKKVFTLAKG
ncbi:glycosyltransferase family 2 protein [Mucilaginibacter phyllosphaerae]